MSTPHRIRDYSKHKEILQWLHDNVQENYNPGMEKYASSSVSRFVEWRSKDFSSWKLRVHGMLPPKLDVWINDPKMEMLFLLKWS